MARKSFMRNGERPPSSESDDQEDQEATVASFYVSQSMRPYTNDESRRGVDRPYSRRLASFPYQYSNELYAEDSSSRSPVLALEELPSRLPPRQRVQTGDAGPASFYALSPSSSSSSAPPRPRRQPKTIEEKRAARQCSVDGCNNYTIDRGRCFRHGGGKTCAVEDCGRSAKARGLCWRHGGSVQCSVEGCDRGAKSKGLCWSHGGGNNCSIDGCQKTIISKGLCWTHGGGKRCTFDGCMRPASESKQNFCNRHHAEFSDGNTVYEV